MRVLLLLLLCLCGCSDSEPKPPATIQDLIPSGQPDVTIVKKKISKEDDRTVYEVTHVPLPAVSEAERLRQYNDLKNSLWALGQLDSGVYAYDIHRSMPMPSEAKNAWQMVIGPGSIVQEGVVRVDLWVTERYPALVTFSKPVSSDKNPWAGPVGDIVLKLNPKRDRRSTAIYRVDEKRFLLMMNP